ncbi:MAG: biliverdin-producing heme oxygenase [Bacteroidia bacterium]
MLDKHQELKKATATIHAETEKLVGAKDLFTNLNLGKYKHFLLSHYLLHKNVSVLYGEIVGLGEEHKILDWPNSNKLSALENDLKKLDVDLPNVESIFREIDYPFWLGLCYVVEGSALGNMHIFKAFSRFKCFNDWNANAFLKRSPEDIMTRWNAFKALLNKDMQLAYKDVEKGAFTGFDLYAKLWTKASSILKD